MNLEKVAQEVRDNYKKYQEEGLSKSQVEERMIASLKYTYKDTEDSVVAEIAFNPVKGAMFVHRVNLSLGAVNEVLYNEFGMEPLHIRDLGIAIVPTLEDFSGKDIDTLLKELDEVLPKDL